FAFAGNLSRKSLQAKIDTFKGTCLCQTSSSTSSKLEVAEKSIADMHYELSYLDQDHTS
ncbi:hypothetical protein A2U01_0067635, partial [Trifolium medium]|nr:hypothetical protein [Trifolium medium]